jgi:ribulose bisphosphate carboxylase small subunit
MTFNKNSYYTIPNSSIYIFILDVLSQDEKEAKLNVFYLNKEGRIITFDYINVKKENTSHWEQSKLIRIKL